jgi:hypothetical protein
MLEIVKVKGDAPLFLEVNVPPLCMPLLVGDPKGRGLLKWVERPSNRESVLTWGVEATPEQVISEMIKMTQERALKDGWDVAQESIAQAQARMKALGIEELMVSGDIVHPKDPSLLGTLIIAGGKCFPVIHNVNRGLSILPPPST